ncbi:MAG TPA: exosortase-associated EpsI family protein [Pirellulales bacterium]|nr:exosortase-associated EpsI family protein [Pirellulales bacterium]
MTTSQRVLLVAVAIVVAQAVVRAAEQYLALLPAVAPEEDLAQAIPLNLEPDKWEGRDVPLDPDVTQTLAADLVVNRDYHNPLGEIIGVNVAVFRNYSLSPPHPPLACYPADGWTLQNTELVPVNRDDPSSPKVPLYAFERQGEQSLVMFWMDLGGHTVFDRDGIRNVLRGLPPRAHQPLLKKVLLHTAVDAPERARLRLQGIAAPLFQATAAYH